MKEGKYIKIVITDTGHGIKPAHLAKVFDPYFTTRDKGAKKGLGLGLSIVHSIIKKHDGHIHIDSIWGKGTTVSIFLPLLEVVSAAESVVRKKISETPRRVLLMDDEEQIRIMSKEILERMGYGVSTVSNGEEAVNEYLLAMDKGAPFDVVLLDLTIKGGMGGLDAIKQIKKADASVKAIIFSGYSADPVMSDFSLYGFSAALTKPVSIPALHETIEKVLAEEKRALPAVSP